ncbi:MAG: Tetratricopeptide (TPR) repeat [Pelagibacterales bacterium]|nr:Tetratricopeptide (TPR) repeat [Pelagibacterales bacterium]
MKFLSKKNYVIFIFLTIFFSETQVFGKKEEIKYTRENISNYFSGLMHAKQGNDLEAFQHLKKIQQVKDFNSRFSIQYVKTLVLLEKFNLAFDFAEKVKSKNEYLFEADLVLGIKYFVEKDYESAEKVFLKLNRIGRYNTYFDDLVGNVMIAWTKALQGKKKESFEFIGKIPQNYRHLTKIQSTFLKCFYDSPQTQKSYEELIKLKNYNFSRYNFFLANYLLFKNKKEEALKIIQESRKENVSNLLLKQTETFLIEDKEKKIKNLFNCKNPNDPLAEFLYVISNFYSSEEEHELSNFYLKISFFLNNKFLPNRTLLAENLYYQKKYSLSKKTYESLKPIGSEYSWHASKSIAIILIEEKGKKYSVKSLEKDFNKIKKPSYEHYYELADFYKNNELYKKSIKYYSLTLKELEENHFLFSKILYKRGTSFEQTDNWENAEKDLIKSLKISPDEAQVLNYLGYAWIDQGINLEKGLEMLEKANSIKGNDGYILDSVGWAHYALKNYNKAEYFLRRAVELMPSDPVVNDHYADTLWMLSRSIQARYFWNYVLKLDAAEKNLKEITNNKLIFGIK